MTLPQVSGYQKGSNFRYGTKRTSRCKLAYVRFWGEADMRCRLALMACAAFDPKRT
jgi:hypothetical protein